MIHLKSHLLFAKFAVNGKKDTYTFRRNITFQ